MSRSRQGWWLPLSLVLALLLGLLPLAEAIAPLRPYWLGLVLIYWIVEDGEQHGLALGFLAGMAGDVVYGTLLGEQAFRLVIMVYLVQRFRHQIRFFPPLQQAAVVGALLLNDRLITAALRFMAGQPSLAPLEWLAPVVGMLLWMPLFVLMDRVRLDRRR